jgi:hypothetical protein
MVDIISALLRIIIHGRIFAIRGFTKYYKEGEREGGGGRIVYFSFFGCRQNPKLASKNMWILPL